jgi:hypothetical protein
MPDKKRFQSQDPDNPKDWELELGLELTDRATQTDEMIGQLNAFQKYPYPEINIGFLESRKKFRERRLRAAKSAFVGLLKLGEVSLEELELNEKEIQDADRDKMGSMIDETVQKLDEKIELAEKALKETQGAIHPKDWLVLRGLRSEIKLLNSRYLWESGDK